MVKQGDVIRINFEPVSGHEQAGTHRPAVVVSNYEFIKRTGLVLVCPITNNTKKFPLHVPLNDECKTTGVVLCEHIRSLDVNSRGYKFVEKLPEDILDDVVDIIFGSIEK